jgi:hypothetical protein
MVFSQHFYKHTISRAYKIHNNGHKALGNEGRMKRKKRVSQNKKKCN